MKVNIEKYANKRICVAVSGGKDSMALLHYLYVHGGQYGISVCALNCDHRIRGADSERDSAFVKAYCEDRGITVHSFVAEKGQFKDENGARKWRLNCYLQVLQSGLADSVATAHHMNDNAETVLFNLARGTAISGVCGIGDEPTLGLIRPLIACSREDIDEYINANGVPFVTDESNLSDDYTRNKIRHNVLPALEQAVHGAVGAIYRFSRLAREDEEYFSRKVNEITVRRGEGNYLIRPCDEKVIFKRAAQRIVADDFHKHDYTSEHMEKLFGLQSSECGKKFEFLGLTAIKENGGIAIFDGETKKDICDLVSFYDFLSGKKACGFSGVKVLENSEKFERAAQSGEKLLSFDIDEIPQSAVIRFKRAGDKFTKFGGGTKSLSDYLTDKKVPQSLRNNLPLVCVESEVLIIGGVEISDKVKITDATKSAGAFICADPFAIK